MRDSDTVKTIQAAELTPADLPRTYHKGLRLANGRQRPDPIQARDRAEFADAIEHARDTRRMRARIVIDPDPMPYEDCDQFGSITYSDRSRYTLGTEAIDAERLRELTADPNILWAPIRAYVHSGETIAVAGPFRWGKRAPMGSTRSGPLPYPMCDPWDSGDSGIVYATRDKVRAEFGRSTKRACRLLRAEVEEFDRHLRGEVYGIIPECETADDSDDWQEFDSCWGFVGSEYAEQEARSMLAYAVLKGWREHQAETERTEATAGTNGAD